MVSRESPIPLQIREAIVDSTEPFLTVHDLAEELDVSPPTVRKHLDEVLQHKHIAKRQVGQATVFYEEDYPANLTSRPVETSEPFREHVLTSRANWLDFKDRFYNQSFGDEEDELRMRILLYYRLFDYVEDGGGLQYQPNAKTDVDMGVRDPREDADLSPDDIDFYDTGIHLFHSPWYGDVEGFSGLFQFHFDLISELRPFIQDAQESKAEEMGQDVDEVSVTLGDLPKEELDRLYPPAGDIVHAGNVFDSFVCELHDIRW